MSVNVDPPANIDPGTAVDQNMTLINQNFQSVTQLLNTSAFLLSESDVVPITVDFAAHGASSSGNDSETVNVDIGPYEEPPLVLVYLKNGGNYNPISDGSVFFSAFTANTWKLWRWGITYTENSLSISFVQSWGTGVGGATSSLQYDFEVKYFVLQQKFN